MTEESYFQRKNRWLIAVAEHPGLCVSAKSIAVKLVLQYLHNELRKSWVGNPRLAKELHVSERSVQRGYAQLMRHGLLRRDPIKRGQSNVYRLPASWADSIVDMLTPDKLVTPDRTVTPDKLVA